MSAAEAAAEIDRIISPDFHSEVARMEAPGGASSDRTMGVFRLDLIDVDKYVLGAQRCSSSGHTFGCRFGFGLKRVLCLNAWR